MASVRSLWHSAAFEEKARCQRLRGESSVAVGDVVVAAPRVAVLEFEEAKGLLEAGQVAGSLTKVEISLALDELDLDTAQMDDFYQALEELQIEVVERDDAADLDETAPDVSTDALQLFLKDVGKVELLTAA